MAHSWIFNGERVSDTTHSLYYRGQKIKEAWYRGEKVWGGETTKWIKFADIEFDPYFGFDVMSARNPVKNESDLAIKISVADEGDFYFSKTGTVHTIKDVRFIYDGYSLRTYPGKNYYPISVSLYISPLIRRIVFFWRAVPGIGHSGNDSIQCYSSYLYKISKLFPEGGRNLPEVNPCLGYAWELREIPDGFVDNIPSVNHFYRAFDCSWYRNAYGDFVYESCKFTNIPHDLFHKHPDASDFGYCFHYARGITSIPEDLFSKQKNVTSFKRCFYSCTNVTGNAPRLWEQFPEADGTKCFAGCKKLSNYSDIPASWK